MLDWLKNLAGGTNRAGLDPKSLENLSKDLGRLERLSPELAQRALRYVVNGEDAAVLAGLANLAGGADLLGLLGARTAQLEDAAMDRRALFQHLKVSDPGFFMRLGRVYEALLGGAPYFSAFADRSLRWLEILLAEALGLQSHYAPGRCRKCPALDAKTVEAILGAAGQPPETLVRAAFLPKLDRYMGAPFEAVFLTLHGLNDCAAREHNVLAEAFRHPDFKQRLYALEMMQKAKVRPEPFLGELLALALGSSRQVGERAEALLAGASAAARPWLERTIAEGDTEKKPAAARLLWQWEKEGARAFLSGRLQEEKNSKVQRVIGELLAAPAPPAENVLPPLPPLPPVSSEAPLGAETARAWEECFQKVNAGIAAMPPGPQRLHAPSARELEKTFANLQNGADSNPQLQCLNFACWTRELVQPIKEFWQRPELQGIHLIRFVKQVGGLRLWREADCYLFGHGGWLETLLPAFRRAHPEFGLRELGAAFTASGLEARSIGHSLLLSHQAMPAPFGLPAALLWPYWLEHLDLLESAFAPPSAGGSIERYYQRYSRRNAFLALATIPSAPPQLVPLLWSLALGPKSERAHAQNCLASLPDKFERLCEALQGGDLETRQAAAEWMGRLGDERGVGVLLAAFKREKHEAAKGALLAALESLGAPVEQFLDRPALLKEAEKGVAKGIPGDLKWFPFEQLPPVHWDDNGARLDPVIVQWWLIQGFKLKSPEPGALLRRYGASLKPSERETLGVFVLEAWLAHDTSPRTGVDAEKAAMQRARDMLRAAQQWAQYVQQNPQAAQMLGSFTPQQKTLEEYYAEILPVVQNEPTGSAISSKGVLALAGACVGPEAAAVVNRYLKQWYGMRVAQCRALLQMLAWVEHKSATQLLLAVGSRFRTKSIQEEANKQAQLLAERKGWTVAELADRTIPSAGLDENGVLTLDFGPRQFTARLDAKLDLALSDPEGAALKSLPDPRQADDAAKAAEAKKTFSAAKKELKSVLSIQRDRLYEGMCIQRTWPFEDWALYINRHPVLRHHCQRLVWGVTCEGRITRLFRPLADGTLTDVADQPVTLQSEDEIRVAHECQVTPEQSLAWLQHLKDYDVEPLFEQFGRPGFELTDERRQQEELIDFRGHLLEAFKLRGRATKLGYTRGQSQDRGWFYDYHKRFPTLDIDAVLDFTGNGLPEENRTVALTGFHFEGVPAEGAPAMSGARMSLGDVPAVLLSECWNDFRQIAAEGPGFDPDWEKKSGV